MDVWTELLPQLKQEYIRGVPERFSQIVSSLDQLEQEPSDYQALKNLLRYFCGLSGTGSTYGFPQVTVLGLQGETECESLIKNSLFPKNTDIARWRKYLLALQQEFPQ